MPTQEEIAQHLDLSQKGVSEFLNKQKIDWKNESLDAIRIKYIGALRAQAAGHKSSDGEDLVRERVLTERVDREMKMLNLAEKRGQLVNVSQLESGLKNMFGAFRTELLGRDDKLKTELDQTYQIDVDLGLLNSHTYAALKQLSRYDPGGESTDPPVGGEHCTSGEIGGDRVGAPAS